MTLLLFVATNIHKLSIEESGQTLEGKLDSINLVQSISG